MNILTRKAHLETIESTRDRLCEAAYAAKARMEDGEGSVDDAGTVCAVRYELLSMTARLDGLLGGGWQFDTANQTLAERMRMVRGSLAHLSATI